MSLPQELCQRMLESGYPLTLRRLTDWRSKGLLPPLVSQGRGKGRGKFYFWKDPDILVRAQFVHHAFAHGATAEIVMLSLVHGGFDVAPKKARRTWVKYLANLEKLGESRIEPGESPRDAFWDQAVQMPPKLSEQGNVSKDIIEPLTAEALLTIYARRGFRQSPEDLGNTTNAVNQYLTAIMEASRYSNIAAPLLDERFVSRVFELLRQGLSVTATKELIKGTTIVQFHQAISATRQVVRVIEVFYATQLAGHTSAAPLLEIRMLFRAIIGPPLTALFLQLFGEGYERKLRKSLHLVEGFIRACEAHPGRKMDRENPKISQSLQLVVRQLFSDLKEIWRDSDLFRMYHIA